MMPEYFTLGELQQVYEVILNKRLLAKAFRRIIANKVIKTDKFRSLDIPTYITRLDDSTLSPTEKNKKILDAFGNDSNVIVISNHIISGGGDVKLI